MQAKFTPAQIAQINNSEKDAIAYISIGEAEDYRYYWDTTWITSPLSWLGPENPDWAGNYKVKFWDPAWQNIIFDYLSNPTKIQQYITAASAQNFIPYVCMRALDALCNGITTGIRSILVDQSLVIGNDIPQSSLRLCRDNIYRQLTSKF